MKFIKLSTYLLLTAFGIIWFKKIEMFLFNANFSWTISKATPYLITIILGFLLAFEILKQLKLIKSIKYIVAFLIFIIPFGVAFAMNPIYEGDFAKNGKKVKFIEKIKDFEGFDLIVLTIPGCPFCHESTFYANKMLERTKDIKIKYIVCNDSIKEIEPYKRLLDKKIVVELASDSKKMAKIAGGAFPAFIAFQNGKPVEQWGNDQFGVRAKDFVENLIK